MPTLQVFQLYRGILLSVNKSYTLYNQTCIKRSPFG